jgi:hypothetical protein
LATSAGIAVSANLALPAAAPASPAVSLTVRGVRWSARPDVASAEGGDAVGIRFDSEDADPRFTALTSDEVRLLGDLSNVGAEYFAWLLERARPISA